MRTTLYSDAIRTTLAEIGHIGVNPNWVEAWMRLEHPTLDGLSARQFRGEVQVAVDCIRASSEAENSSLARSYGLQP